MQIGTYIKLILRKKNMTQQALVDKSGIPKTHISSILNGHEDISFLRARKIEIALDLPKYELVEMVGFPKTEQGRKKLEELG